MKAATQKHPLSNRTEQLLQQRGEYLEEMEQLEARVPGLETKLAELRRRSCIPPRITSATAAMR